MYNPTKEENELNMKHKLAYMYGLDVNSPTFYKEYNKIIASSIKEPNDLPIDSIEYYKFNKEAYKNYNLIAI